MVTANKNLLKSLRVATGKKQHEVAKEIGISTQQYAKYEQGQQEPRVSMGKKIAKSLNTNTDVVASFYEKD